MDNNIILIGIIILLIVCVCCISFIIIITIYGCDISKILFNNDDNNDDKIPEFFNQFNQKDIDFAKNIINELNILNYDLSYTGYLKLLTKYNNISLNLISQSSYEKIISNKNLTPSDIISLL